MKTKLLAILESVIDGSTFTDDAVEEIMSLITSDGFSSTSYSLPAPTSIALKDRETGEWTFTLIEESDK